MFKDRIKEDLDIQGKSLYIWNIAKVEAHGLMNDVPPWDSTESIEKEIMTRFSRCNRADMDARLIQCHQFDQMWEGPRT